MADYLKRLLSEPVPAELPSSEEMRAAEARAIESGTPSLTLMERAGDRLFEYLTHLLEETPDKDRGVVICIGPGNNGGDGIALARRLREHRRKVEILLVPSSRYSAELEEQCKRLKESAAKLGEKVESFTTLWSAEGETRPPSEFAKLPLLKRTRATLNLKEYAIVVDALLGTGSKAAPRGGIAALLAALAAGREALPAEDRPLMLAVDLPTGVDADTGEVFEPHFAADETVTIDRIKRGMVQFPGAGVCGRIAVRSIDLPDPPSRFSLLNRKTLPPLKDREPASHKGTFGHLLVIGGSYEMPGAPILAAHAALRAGAGLVTLMRIEGAPPVSLAPELLQRFVRGADGVYSSESIDELEEAISKATAVVVGPGLGVDPRTSKFVSELLPILEKGGIPMVIDADGLNIVAGWEGAKGGSGAILTPHPAEAARLLGSTTAEVQLDRYGAAEKIARERNSVCVLKGASSIVYGGDRGFVNLTGNPYMATPGMGDVLSGIIGALLASGRTLLDAAALGTYIHGLAGDRIIEGRRAPILASDLIEELPFTFAELLAQ